MSEMVLPKRVYFILGMHRSGTSALTGSISKVGLDVGRSLMPPNEFNTKGYFENSRIINLNSKILKHFGCDWKTASLIDRVVVDGIPNDFFIEAKSIVLEEYSSNNILIKDPRLCILLPFWEKVFTELQYKINIIYIFRNPFDVYRSLFKRDNIEKSHADHLWLIYNFFAEYYSRNHERIFVSLDSLIYQPEKTLDHLLQFISLNGQAKDFEKKELSAFIDPDMISFHNPAHENSLQQDFFNLIKNNNLKTNVENIEIFDIYRKTYTTFNKFVFNDLRNNIQSSSSDNFKPLYSQLFFDLGDGIREENSKRIFVDKNSRFLEFNLFEYNTINNLRFDPINDYTLVNISEMFLVDQYNNYIELEIKQTNAFSVNEKSYLFLNKDPQIYFKNFVPGRYVKLFINLQFINISSEVIPYITKNINELKDDLSYSQNEIQRLEQRIDEIKPQHIEMEKLKNDHFMITEDLKIKSKIIESKDLSISNLQRLLEENNSAVDYFVNKNSKLQSTINLYEEKTIKYQDEKEELHNSIFKMRQEFFNAYTKLKEKNSSLKFDIIKANEEKQQLQKVIVTKQEKISQLEGELRNNKERIVNYEEKINIQLSKINENNTIIETLEKDNKSQFYKYKEVNSLYLDLIEKSSIETEKLKNQIYEKDDSINEQSIKLSKLYKLINVKNNHLKKAGKLIKNKINSIEIKNIENFTLKQKIYANEEQTELLVEEKNRLLSKINEFKESLHNNRLKSEKLKDSNRISKLKINYYKEKHNDLITKNKAILESISAKDQLIDKLLIEKNQADSKINQVEKDLLKANKNYQDKKNQADELLTSISSKDDIINRLFLTIKEKDNKIESIKKIFNEMNTYYINSMSWKVTKPLRSIKESLFNAPKSPWENKK